MTEHGPRSVMWSLAAKQRITDEKDKCRIANIVSVDEELLCKEMKTPPRKTTEEAPSALLDEEANGGWCCRLRWSR